MPLPCKGFRVWCSGADHFYSLLDSFLLKHNTFIQIFRDTFNKLAFGNSIHKPKLDVLSRVSSMTKTCSQGSQAGFVTPRVLLGKRLWPFEDHMSMKYSLSLRLWHLAAVLSSVCEESVTHSCKNFAWSSVL